ncbi:MAG: hypothetical protein ACI85N_000758 [Gammaproteobacteria bacterium]|jgi:hypothetical protein
MKQKKPNPQGKGVSTVLDALVDSQIKTSLPPKNIDQVSSELFTSLFVLNTNFEFRPIAGNSYWLYHTRDKFKLFSTAPNDWACGQPGIFIGECILQNDVTWTVQLNQEVSQQEWFISHMEEQKNYLQESLENSTSLEEAMPYYVKQLSYYSRLLAYGLGSSLNTSMKKSGINALQYEQAKILLSFDAK